MNPVLELSLHTVTVVIFGPITDTWEVSEPKKQFSGLFENSHAAENETETTKDLCLRHLVHLTYTSNVKIIVKFNPFSRFPGCSNSLCLIPLIPFSLVPLVFFEPCSCSSLSLPPGLSDVHGFLRFLFYSPALLFSLISCFYFPTRFLPFYPQQRSNKSSPLYPECQPHWTARCACVHLPTSRACSQTSLTCPMVADKNHHHCIIASH